MQCAINSTLAVRWNENNRTTTDGGLHVSGMNGRYMHVHISYRNLFPLWSETHYFSYDFISKRFISPPEIYTFDFFLATVEIFHQLSTNAPSCVVIVLDQAVVWWWPNKVLLITITINGSDTITTVGRRRHHRRTFFVATLFQSIGGVQTMFYGVTSIVLPVNWIGLDCHCFGRC